MTQIEVFRNLVDIGATYVEIQACVVTIKEKANYYLIRVEEVGLWSEYADLYVYSREKDEIIQHETIKGGEP